MNNKLTRQQAIEYIRDFLDDGTAGEALAALDDTRVEDPERFEGFSNRETWAAHWYITHDSDVCEDLKDKETGDGVKAWFEHAFRELIEMKEENAIQALADIGSLWRVNWDEVATALLGGE